MAGNLDLNNLLNNRGEIIKAEIANLFILIDKTSINFWKNKGFFKESSAYSYQLPDQFIEEIEKIDEQLQDLFTNVNINIIDETTFDQLIKELRSPEKRLVKILARGCENVNSGIDKGAPKEKLKSLWIANAFGSFKEEVKEDYLDKRRRCFFDKLADEIKQFNKKIEQFSFEEWVQIRNFILNEIKLWYVHLLSDSRFPINDVTLWDQTYMTATMFKAALAAMFLETEKINEYSTNPQNIKWSILGIQYDKLGLAEKGLKPGYIQWYRETAREVDNEVKNIIETRYCLGNEIYRDETGIYFLVPENVCGEQEGKFYRLSDELKDIRQEILDVFSNQFKAEVYPAIFLTKPSRGIMNMAYLIDKAKENFLTAEYPKNFEKNFEIKCELSSKDEELKEENSKKSAYTICQICGLRLAEKKKRRRQFSYL